MDNIVEEKFKVTKENINNFLDILFQAYNNLKKKNIELTKKNKELQIEVSRYYSYDW
jgi:cell division septum initiation protein DivIVA